MGDLFVDGRFAVRSEHVHVRTGVTPKLTLPRQRQVDP